MFKFFTRAAAPAPEEMNISGPTCLSPTSPTSPTYSAYYNSTSPRPPRPAITITTRSSASSLTSMRTSVSPQSSRSSLASSPASSVFSYNARSTNGGSPITPQSPLEKDVVVLSPIAVPAAVAVTISPVSSPVSKPAPTISMPAPAVTETISKPPPAATLTQPPPPTRTCTLPTLPTLSATGFTLLASLQVNITDPSSSADCHTSLLRAQGKLCLTFAMRAHTRYTNEERKNLANALEAEIDDAWNSDDDAYRGRVYCVAGALMEGVGVVEGLVGGEVEVGEVAVGGLERWV